MPEKNALNQKLSEKEIDMVYVIPEQLPTLYSDNFLVQNRDAIFFLYFMQNQFPVVFNREEIETINKVESRCFAKISTTAVQFARNLKAMEENFGRFLEIVGSPAKDYKEFLQLIEKNQKVTGSENK